MSPSVVLGVFLTGLVLVVAQPAQAAEGCRYRSGSGPVRVHSLPYRTARTVGVLPAGGAARGACGRVWNGAHEWTHLDRPVAGYVVSAHVRRA